MFNDLWPAMCRCCTNRMERRQLGVFIERCAVSEQINNCAVRQKG